jgi:precorrin-4/cobalt-precorrin-4 C11-methyltransferase
MGLVSFVGAGPGAPDLITLRGRDRIAEADVVVYADSLVHPGVAAYAKPNAEIYKSAALTLEETSTLMLTAARAGRRIARVQSGDPSIYGAMHEQIALLESEGVPYEIIPGVSSAFAAAAALGVELTVPDITQTVIFTRLGSRTPMPEREALRDLARHGASIAIFLSIPLIERVVDELLAGGYPIDTAAAVVHRVTWEDELILRGTLADIAGRVKDARLQLQALILVGPALDDTLRARGLEHRSNLYNPAFTQRHRRSSTA